MAKDSKDKPTKADQDKLKVALGKIGFKAQDQADAVSVAPVGKSRKEWADALKAWLKTRPKA